MNLIQTDASRRVQWIDCARGIAITLVVFHHAVIFLSARGVESDLLTRADNLLVSVRMPLFFMAAGFFASRPISHGWRYLWAKRLALLVWIYTLWSLIRFAVFSVVPWPLETSDAGTIESLASSFVFPSGTLWFIYALALYYSFAKILASSPTYPLLLVAGVVSATFSSGVLTTGDYEWDSVLTFFVFFLAGCRLRDRVVNAVERSGPAILAFITIAFIIISMGAYVSDLQHVPGVRLTASICGVLMTFIICKYWSRIKAASLLNYLGRTTMPIYLLHYFPLAVLVVYVKGPVTKLPAIPASLILTVVVIALCLVLYRATRRLPGLYEPPKSIRREVNV